MKQVTLIDDHPGKWNEGVNVVLCNVYNNISKEQFVTGFSKSHIDKGMFSKDEQPVQDLSLEEDGWHFTMFNHTSVSREQVNEILKGGFTLNRYYEKEDKKPYFSLSFELQ